MYKNIYYKMTSIYKNYVILYYISCNILYIIHIMIHIILQTCFHVTMYYNYNKTMTLFKQKHISINLVK
jgi:hypothetical protein